jgi:signal peptidase I
VLSSSVAFVVAAAVGISWLRRNWAVITVEGPSMEPTFHAGDRVAVRRTPGFTVSSGDVVVIERHDGSPAQCSRRARGWDARRWMIKRVGAVAGEPVPEGIPVPDPVVPDGKLVLLGDNAKASFDSRTVGYFPADHLLGGVVRRMH